MSDKSAERIMSLAEKFGDKIDIMSNLSLTVLYELAAPNTTEEVRSELTGKAAAGEKITVADVQALKKKTKTRAAVVDHGIPALVDAVDRGEVSISAASAFVHDHTPKVQDLLVVKADGSVADAVKKAADE